MTSEETYAALLLAIARHHGQLRKGSGAPYVLHPVRVARSACRAARGLGLDEGSVQAIELAALLHDTLEDTGTTAAELEGAFGGRVTGIVRELTQERSLPKPERRRRMVEHCGAMSLEARIVKLADRLDNLRELPRGDAAFVRRYVDEARAMLERMRGTAPALEEAIARIVADAAGDGAA